jgi:nicotinamidase-related amidase
MHPAAQIGRVPRLEIDRMQLLVIDVQERLLPRIHEHASVTAQIVRMLRIAAELRIPVTLSEQYPQGLGRTVAEVRAAAEDAPTVQKAAFSVCGETAPLERLSNLDRPQVVVAGIEAHVCVQQTALDLADNGFQPCVLADAVGSRRAFDRDIALERVRAAGVLVTTVEAAAFELLRRCDSPLFKRVLEHVR